MILNLPAPIKNQNGDSNSVTASTGAGLFVNRVIRDPIQRNFIKAGRGDSGPMRGVDTPRSGDRPIPRTK